MSRSASGFDVRPLPEGFTLGAATAAYQIEGSAFEDGRGPSIWDTFSRVPGAILTGENGDVACDHYRRYQDDVQMMRRMGLDSYRFSIAWPRIFPDGKTFNSRGGDFYSRLVDELLEAEILPWPTLYHWDLPQALQDEGGWLNRDTTDRFADYAAKMQQVLGDRITAWTTLNEPWCSSFLSHTAGLHAPGLVSVRGGLLSSHHLLLAHGKAINTWRSENSSQDLGVTLNLTVATAADAENPADVDAARRIDGQFNRWFLDPIFEGEYPNDIIADFTEVDRRAVEDFAKAIRPGDMDVISTNLDFLGVNYYHGEHVSGIAPKVAAERTEAPTPRETASPFPSNENIFWVERGLPRTDMNWEIDPGGLTTLLKRVSDDYTAKRDVALYVTENGAAFDDVVMGGPTADTVPTADAVPTTDSGSVEDTDRARFLEDHIAATIDAIDEGVDVRGYYYWSLMDNYEWAWGYSKRFGLVRVNYETQQRTLKRSAKTYMQIIEERALRVGDGK